MTSKLGSGQTDPTPDITKVLQTEKCQGPKLSVFVEVLGSRWNIRFPIFQMLYNHPRLHFNN